MTGNDIIGIANKKFWRNFGWLSNDIPSPPTFILMSSELQVINGNKKYGSAKVRFSNQKHPEICVKIFNSNTSNLKMKQWNDAPNYPPATPLLLMELRQMEAARN